MVLLRSESNAAFADGGIDNPSAPAGHLPLHRGGFLRIKLEFGSYLLK